MRVEHNGTIFYKSDFLNTFRLKCKMVPKEKATQPDKYVNHYVSKGASRDAYAFAS